MKVRELTNSTAPNNTQFYRTNLKRIVWETILTSIGVGFSVSIMTVFWNSIGMNQTEIGLTQMIFTIAVCLLDIPMGYIADRFNRKLLNIVGDIGVAFTFVLYALANNMYMAILAECLLGVFMAMTNGVDSSFIKFNCDKIDPSGKLFKQINVKIHTARYISLFIVVFIGGLVAKISLRLSIALSFIPYFIGGLIALRIHDFDSKIIAKHSNPIKDMITTIKDIVKQPKVKPYLLACVLGKEATHAQIWIFTPLLMSVGIPLEIVSLGWMLEYIMQAIGSKISEKFVKSKVSLKFATPMIIELIWMIVLIVHTNIITIWLFALNGFVHGLTEGTLATSLQEVTENKVQTSIMSVVSTLSRLVYIPLVYFINYLANIKLQFGLAGVVIAFLPICIFTFFSLRKTERTK